MVDSPAAPATPTPRRRRLSAGRKVMFGLVACLLALLLLEVAGQLVLAMRRPVVQSPRWYRRDETFGWRPQPGFIGAIPGEGIVKRFDDEGFLAIDHNKLGDARPKILVIGDSTAFGFGVQPEHAYAQFLNEELPQFAVINLGFLGYSSYHGVQLCREYLARFKPELVIFSFNHNDRRYVLFPDEVDGPEYYARYCARARRGEWLAHSSVFQAFAWLTDALRGRRAGGLDPLADHARLREARLDALTPRVSGEAYLANLREAARLVRQSGGRMLFLKLGDNPRMTAPLRAARDELNAGRDQQAIGLLEALVTSDTTFSTLARVELAEIYRKQGRDADVRRVSQILAPRDSIHGGHPIAWDTTYGDLMTRVAGEEQALLVDGAAILDARPDLYFDFCHFWLEGHLLIARALADQLREAGLAPPTRALASLR